ncbi:hypothetical protein ILYODFUR_030907 [Ilyodon furcidens]|uniref:Uncharacterized protein n=1 Tax=Ilyodon furcidens TaxID=33524 RepID=A0ABV0T4D2_9TELE
MMAWQILMSRHCHTFGSKLHMHGPIHSKLSMLDLCQSLNSSITLHWNLDQQRHLGHFNCSISLIHHRIHMKCSLHHQGSMLNMLPQSVHDIISAPPTNKKLSAASIWKVGFSPNFKCFLPDENSALPKIIWHVAQSPS